MTTGLLDRLPMYYNMYSTVTVPLFSVLDRIGNHCRIMVLVVPCDKFMPLLHTLLTSVVFDCFLCSGFPVPPKNGPGTVEGLA